MSSEELGGAAMHAQISGTIDYRDPTDEACLERLRRLAAHVPADPAEPTRPVSARGGGRARRGRRAICTAWSAATPHDEYEVRDVLAAILDAGSFDEYKAEYGQSVVCGTARLGGFSIGVVANQHHRVRPAEGPLEFGGVMYVDSAEKAARFVMNCNQDWLPILFLQDVNGFMVGRDSERAGIIKAGAKLVNAISNSRVPKLTVIIGGSFGAGNYALCGKAFDPRLIFAWPNARCAVMGADQATSTLLEITVKSLQREGQAVDAEQLARLKDKIKGDYQRQTDVRYGAAVAGSTRFWIPSKPDRR